MNDEERWPISPRPSEEEPSHSGGEGGAPGLREVLEELFESQREPPAPTLQHSRYRGGIVPPPGPLPRRFGPPAYRVWFTRLLAAAALLFGLGSWLDLDMEELDAGFRILAILLLAGAAVWLGLRSWYRSKIEIEALAVLFEPSGVRVSTPFFSRRLAWGDLVGLDPPPDGKDWVLRAVVAGRPLLVRLPGRQAWARRLVAVLRGNPDPGG